MAGRNLQPRGDDRNRGDHDQQHYQDLDRGCHLRGTLAIPSLQRDEAHGQDWVGGVKRIPECLVEEFFSSDQALSVLGRSATRDRAIPSNASKQELHRSLPGYSRVTGRGVSGVGFHPAIVRTCARAVALSVIEWEPLA